MKIITRTLGYVKARLLERSTWAGIIGGFTGASALQEPWSYAAGTAGAIMAIIPTTPGEKPAAPSPETPTDPEGGQ